MSTRPDAASTQAVSPAFATGAASSAWAASAAAKGAANAAARRNQIPLIVTILPAPDAGAPACTGRSRDRGAGEQLACQRRRA